MSASASRTLIDVALNPAEIGHLPERDLSRTTCVVFDVLRATSTIVTALAHGAAAIHPVRTIEEARAKKAMLPDALLGGERHGERIPGFDLGNSPLEYQALPGRTIITTTTNGTMALGACGHAARVLVGAVLNIGALAAHLRTKSVESLLLVCAGTFETFALEDAFAAGLLIGELEGELSDSAHAALAVAGRFATPLEALEAARNGRALAGKGRGEEVRWCAQPSRYNIVAVMDQAIIRLFSA